MKYFIPTLLIALVFNSCVKKQSKEKSTDPQHSADIYLGQKPPGLTPIPFAPGLVSTDLYEANSAFTPDMKAFYFIRRGEENKTSAFYEYKYNEINGMWEKSEVASP